MAQPVFNVQLEISVLGGNLKFLSLDLFNFKLPSSDIIVGSDGPASSSSSSL